MASPTQRNEARHWLVTGGAGFIGSHLCDALVARGDGVTILDDLSTGRIENVASACERDDVRFVEGSATDAALVDELMAEVDGCLHLASAVGVQLVVDNPLESLLNNVRGTDVVLSAAARHGRRLLFTSTSEVYGKNSTGALEETSDRILGSPFKARWAYAIAKSFGESLAHSLHREHGCPFVVVRLFNTVGPRQQGRYGMVLPRFVQQALSGEELTVYGSGSQSRCFAHVHDTVRAIVLLLDHPGATGDVFNIGGTREISIVDLARRVIARTGSRSTIRFVPYDEAYGDGFEELGRRQPDTSKTSALVGWAPSRTVDDAIDDIARHERARLVTDASLAV
jgi:UDP-glucose 4-epimerase